MFILSVLFFTQVSFADVNCDWELVNNKSELSKYNFAIVPGMFNELLAYYMVEHRNFLLRNGVPDNQIYRINNSSLDTPKDSAKKMYMKIKQIKNNKPWVIVAHSKGALETMYLLRDYENNLNIKKIYFFQGALDGASFNHTLYSLVEIFVDIPFFKKLSQSFYAKKIREDLSKWSGDEKLWEKIFFITSETDFKGIPFELRLGALLNLKSSQKVGDGVLQLQDQLPYFLQTKNICKKEFKAHHTKFVKVAPYHFSKRKKLESFISKLFLGNFD